MDYGRFQINIFNVFILSIMIFTVALLILFIVDPDKSFAEHVYIYIYNSIPITDKYKDSIFKYMQTVIHILDIIAQKVFDKLPSNIVNNVCKNIEINKKKILSDNNIKKIQNEQNEINSNINKFYEPTAKPTTTFSMSDDLINTIDDNKPWDNIFDKNINIQGTIDDIDWKAYIYNYRPKIIVY